MKRYPGYFLLWAKPVPVYIIPGNPCLAKSRILQVDIIIVVDVVKPDNLIALSRSALARWKPMKPAVPVTRYFDILKSKDPKVYCPDTLRYRDWSQLMSDPQSEGQLLVLIRAAGALFWPNRYSF